MGVSKWETERGEHNWEECQGEAPKVCVPIGGEKLTRVVGPQ